jgi:hypothetical protein
MDEINYSEKEWILLFHHYERDELQNNLNTCIRDFEVLEIKVWNDKENWWNASVRYKSTKQ